MINRTLVPNSVEIIVGICPYTNFNRHLYTITDMGTVNAYDLASYYTQLHKTVVTIYKNITHFCSCVPHLNADASVSCCSWLHTQHYQNLFLIPHIYQHHTVTQEWNTQQEIRRWDSRGHNCREIRSKHSM
jgi:hypothetical protein